MENVIYCVFLINCVTPARCMNCVWETRFHPEKPVASYYPHAGHEDYDFIQVTNRPSAQRKNNRGSEENDKPSEAADSILNDIENPRIDIKNNLTIVKSFNKSLSNIMGENLALKTPSEESDGTGTPITLHIVGLFAMSGEYPAGISYLPAALIAIRGINNDPDILPGYKLQLNIHDTRCLPEWGLDGLYTELYNKNRTSIMTLGTTCSHVAESTATVSNIWGMVQISYSAVSPHLSNKTIFPSFFRVTTPEQILINSITHMLKANNWSRVHTIYQNYKLFSTLNEQMDTEFEAHNITVVSGNMFTTDPTQSVKKLQEGDARVIIGSFYEDMARKIMCAAHNLPDGYDWYKNVVWFLPSFLDRGWMNLPHGINCTSKDIMKVVGQYFTIGSINYNVDPLYKPVGNVSREIFEDFNLYSATKEDIPSELQHLYAHCKDSPKNCSLFAVHRAPQAFDAIWAIALALNTTLEYLGDTGDPRRLEDFDYGENNRDMSCLIRQAMENVTFNALSGPFSFNENGDATTSTGILRYNNSGKPNFTLVGNCSINRDRERWSCHIDKDRIEWNTPNGKPPYDGMQTRMRPIEISVGIRMVFFSLACIGILTSLCLLVFNVWNRNHRIIKMSSPRLNNIILVGSVLAYIDIVIQDDGRVLNISICKIRLFTKPLSFCLMFGSLFAKTWRVYQIFTAGAHAYKLNKKLLRDSSLFLIVAGLVAITSGILGTWMVISPQEAVTANISVTGVHDSSNLDVDIVYVNQFHHCDSIMEQEFTIGLSVFYGCMIIFGAFLAIQTRKVSYPEFNDSRLIAMAIYNVVVVEPVGRIMTWAITDKPEVRYAMYCVMQITMSSVTLGLLFVPKIISYRRHNRQGSESCEEHSSDIRRVSNRTNGSITVQSAQRMSYDNSHDSQDQKSKISFITSPIPPATIHSSYENLRASNTENVSDNLDHNKLDNLKINLGNQKDNNSTGTNRKMVSMEISPVTISNLLIQESNPTVRLATFKRSLSDTNILSGLQRTHDDVFQDSEVDRVKSRTNYKPTTSRRYSNSVYHHDDTFIHKVKFKTDVKVKAWSGVFGMSKGLKASWKQKGYTHKCDTDSSVNLIL